MIIIMIDNNDNQNIIRIMHLYLSQYAEYGMAYKDRVQYKFHESRTSI